MERMVSVSVKVSVDDNSTGILEEFEVDANPELSTMQISAISEVMGNLIKLELSRLVAHSD